VRGEGRDGELKKGGCRPGRRVDANRDETAELRLDHFARGENMFKFSVKLGEGERAVNCGLIVLALTMLTDLFLLIETIRPSHTRNGGKGLSKPEIGLVFVESKHKTAWVWSINARRFQVKGGRVSWNSSGHRQRNQKLLGGRLNVSPRWTEVQNWGEFELETDC